MSLQRISHGGTTEDSRAYSNWNNMGNKCQWGANYDAHVKDGSTIVSWFYKSASEDGLRTITRWDRPYVRCIDWWRLACIMQRNNVPNLYASEKTIPAMTGQQSWNRLEKVGKCPKCPEKQTNLDTASSQVKSHMKPIKMKFWKNFAFSKLRKRILDSPLLPFELESKCLEKKEQIYRASNLTVQIPQNLPGNP